MKKISLIAIAIVAFSMASCKKDHVCECTTTHTDESGDVTTNPMDNTTYREVKKSDAKSLCQKASVVQVDEDGGTSTTVYDCKLK